MKKTLGLRREPGMKDESAMPNVSIDEAQVRLLELIENLPLGDELVITRDGRPVARLVREKPTSWPCQPGTAKGILSIQEDDDEHLRDFEEYME
jgi:antitoxin (DNA-binding transcriptional repressor) of toxin-antitoxin stability system